MKQPEKAKTSRRGALKALGLGAAGAAGAAALASKPAEALDAPVKQGGGYRETDHVKMYYELARS